MTLTIHICLSFHICLFSCVCEHNVHKSALKHKMFSEKVNVGKMRRNVEEKRNNINTGNLYNKWRHHIMPSSLALLLMDGDGERGGDG